MPRLYFPPHEHSVPSRLTLKSGIFHLSPSSTSRMNQYSKLASIVLLLALFTVGHAELIQHTECSYDPPSVSNCTVHEVQVDPCAEAAEGLPCRVKRGSTVGISFNYTANFEGEHLKKCVYWVFNGMDLPLPKMTEDACKDTTCPARPGEKQTFTVQLPIAKHYPVKAYDLKWRLWNELDQECCFLFKIKLHK